MSWIPPIFITCMTWQTVEPFIELGNTENMTSLGCSLILHLMNMRYLQDITSFGSQLKLCFIYLEKSSLLVKTRLLTCLFLFFSSPFLSACFCFLLNVSPISIHSSSVTAVLWKHTPLYPISPSSCLTPGCHVSDKNTDTIYIFFNLSHILLYFLIIKDFDTYASPLPSSDHFNWSQCPY